MMDNNSLEQLIKKHHKDAFLWACQCCYYDQEEGKEVLQQTYVKIVEGKARFTERSTIKTWLFSVIRFTAIDHMKKKKQFTTLEKIPQIMDSSDDWEASSVDYKKLLMSLPERQQQVLLLSFYHEMTLAQIAEVTQLHIGTVRTHYERGKATLKQLILNKRKLNYG